MVGLQDKQVMVSQRGWEAYLSTCDPALQCEMYSGIARQAAVLGETGHIVTRRVRFWMDKRLNKVC